MAKRSLGSITERSRGVFTVRVTIGEDLTGKRHTKSVTVRGTKKDAQIALAELIRMSGSDRSTFAAAAKRWLKLREGRVAQVTIDRNRQHVEKVCRLAPRFAEMKVDAIRPSDIEQLATLLSTEGRNKDRPNAQDKPTSLAPRTVRHIMVVVGAVFKMLEKDGAIRGNPARLADPVKLDDTASDIKHLDLDQIDALIAQLEGIYRDIALLAVATGMRRNELLALTWDAVDLDAGTVNVSRALKRVGTSSYTLGRPKTSAGSRIVTLPQFAIDLLRQMRIRQGESWLDVVGKLPAANKWFVFPSVRDPSTYAKPDTVTKRIVDACKKLGIDAGLHTIRHSHATLLLASEPLPAVSRRLGHANTQVTAMVYSHALKEADQQAAASVQMLLGRFAQNSHNESQETASEPLPAKAVDE